MSKTVTVNDVVPVLSTSSVALQVTGVAAIGNVVVPTTLIAGSNAVQSEATMLPASVADGGLTVTMAPSAAVAAVLTSVTGATTGGVLSRTVIVNVSDALFPLLSVAEQVTTVAVGFSAGSNGAMPPGASVTS
jgi:hypothetical protein